MIYFINFHHRLKIIDKRRDCVHKQIKLLNECLFHKKSIDILVYLPTYVPTCICVCMCICIYVYSCVCVYAYMGISRCLYIYIYIYVCVYIYIYIYIYICSEQVHLPRKHRKQCLSTETDINTRLAKTWTVNDRISVIWELDLADEIKRNFFQASVVSIRL